MISSNYQNNKIGFSANIEFCTLQAFENKLAKGIRVSTWQPQKGKEIGTDGILMCNAGGITGGETNNNLVFHIFPPHFFDDLSRNFKQLEIKFKETISSLRQEQKGPQALIFGGDVKYDDSKEVMVVLKHFFEKFKIDHTVFWGTGNKNNRFNSSEKNIFYDGNKDTWHVNLVKSGESVLDAANAHNSFDYIKLSSKDKIKFSDTDWINGKDGRLDKGHLYLTIEDVFRKYGVDPKVLETL
ncbi:MAG: hypothetical protein A2039_05815 [Candidatus Melainabacteria bacterium GWA2_34_9]|nr:MAG: hypothetical protein A2039_05815 [Candidatus Melainabacteria bacterium GWA2_34_9]